MIISYQNASFTMQTSPNSAINFYSPNSVPKRTELDDQQPDETETSEFMDFLNFIDKPTERQTVNEAIRTCQTVLSNIAYGNNDNNSQNTKKVMRLYWKLEECLKEYFDN